MKKLIFALMALMIMGNVSFAQEKKKPVKEMKNPGVEKVQKVEPNAKPAEKGPSAKAPMTKGEAAQPKLKKDGTPDMRYQANKDAAKEAKPAGPLKKDGTPDMRHKANKAGKAEAAP
jgi:hypothetical protein